MSDRLKASVPTKEALVAVAVFVVTLGVFSLDWSHSLGGGFHNLRGGVSTVGAERVLRGEIPYRDFWTIYAPGHFYLLALLFRVFGTHLLVEVVAASVVCATAACVCFLLALNLTGRRATALVSAGVFAAAMYTTGYFRRLGSYPPAVLLVFVACSLMVAHYRTKKIGLLMAAGLATGGVVVFKHDVGGYMAVAIVAGMVADHLLRPAMKIERVHPLLLRLLAYCAGVALIAFPVSIYFALLAGPEMLQDLVIFPLTDFRFSRPESYPSLLPPGLYAESPVEMLANVANYVNFTVPFGLFLLGVAATGLAALRDRREYAALGVTFSVAYLLHYVAAHVQINTHIITMSTYATWLAGICYSLAERRWSAERVTLAKLVGSALIVGWFLSLVAKPASLVWRNVWQSTIQLKLAKVSGFKVWPEEGRILEELSAFVEAHTLPDQKLFVGLHRHDIVVIGDVMIYFILNRPIATDYQELHPAIADTAPVQREIIADLEAEDVPLVILKHIFTDDVLDSVKEKHRRNLPQIGATDLDRFIRENYVKVRSFGPYDVWRHRQLVRDQPGPPNPTPVQESAGKTGIPHVMISMLPTLAWSFSGSRYERSISLEALDLTNLRTAWCAPRPDHRHVQ